MTAAFWPMQLASLLGVIPPTEVTQILVLWLGYYDSGTRYTARPALATKTPPLKHPIPTSVLTKHRRHVEYICNAYNIHVK